jgi:hypothetical protein
MRPDKQVAIIEDGSDASESVPGAAVVGELPSLFDFTGLPIESDIFVVTIALARAIEKAGGSRDHRNHDVRVVDLARVNHEVGNSFRASVMYFPQNTPSSNICFGVSRPHVSWTHWQSGSSALGLAEVRLWH